MFVSVGHFNEFRTELRKNALLSKEKKRSRGKTGTLFLKREK